jgi:hypothetical protein
MEWQALGGNAPSTRQFGAFSQALEVQVGSVMGMSRSTAAKVLAAAVVVVLLLVGVGYRLRAQKQVIQIAAPNSDVRVEKLPDISLSAEEGKLFQTAFRAYKRVVVEKEFMSGYSGARTFMLTPLRADQKADARTIIKISDQESIRREYHNYQKYVKNTLPPTTARIQQQPVARKNAPIAALQYTFIGMPGETPLSLRQQLLADHDERWFYKLVETYGPNWWMQRHSYTFRLGEEYDRKLPAHLVIHPSKGEGRIIHAGRVPDNLNVSIGDLVRLEGFEVKSRNPQGGKISLIGKAIDGNPPVRISYMGSHLPGKIVGEVFQTRSSFLAEVSEAFETAGYPDPIPLLPDLLSETVQGTRSIIHGDLNLENILIGPGNLLWLLDFSETREGHTLFDLAHLFAEIIAHVLAHSIVPSESYFKELEAGGDRLLQAMEDIAERFLFDPDTLREFHLAAIVSCLGALKYENLGLHAKHLLYQTAAHLSENL